jgi:hypothetical protein
MATYILNDPVRVGTMENYVTGHDRFFKIFNIFLI